METIVGAIISAVASIIVAVLSRPRERGPSDVSRRIAKPAKTAPRKWLIPSLALLAWLVLSPVLVDQDLAAVNFLVIPGFLGFLALFLPVRPLSAAAISLGFSGANFLIVTFSNMLGFNSANLLPSDSEGLVIFFGFTFGGAAAVWAICATRLALRRPSHEGIERERPIERSKIAELATLAELHAKGRLTDEEFARTKEELFRRT